MFEFASAVTSCRRTIQALVFAGALAVSFTAGAQGKWSPGPPIPEGANEVIGANVNGQLLVYGGQDQKGPMGIFWRFDPASGQWSKLPSNPVAVHHAAGTAIGNRMYVFGGFRNPDSGKVAWFPENKAWMFDLDKQTWTRLPDMPTARGALAVTAAPDGKIYVVGGARIPDNAKIDALTPGGPVELLGTIEVFDTKTQTWSSRRPMPTPRNHMDASYVDGKIYVIGGRVGSCFSGGWSTNIFMNEAYDIATDSWATRAPIPTPRSGTASAVLDGRISVLGGEGWLDDFGGVFRTHEIYDPKANVWTRAARMSVPRHGFAVAAIGHKIYAVSGVNNAGGAGTLAVITTNESFEP